MDASTMPPMSRQVHLRNVYHYARATKNRNTKNHSKPCTTTIAEDPCNETVKFEYLRVYLYFPR